MVPGRGLEPLPAPSIPELCCPVYTITSVGLRSLSYEQVAFLASIHKPLHFQRKIPTNFAFFKMCMSTALHYDTSKKTKLSKHLIHTTYNT